MQRACTESRVPWAQGSSNCKKIGELGAACLMSKAVRLSRGGRLAGMASCHAVLHPHRQTLTLLCWCCARPIGVSEHAGHASPRHLLIGHGGHLFTLRSTRLGSPRLRTRICSTWRDTSKAPWPPLQAAAAAGLHPGAAQPHMSDGSGSEPVADEEMAEVPAGGASMEQVQREVQQKQAAFEAAQGAQVPGKGPSGDRGQDAVHPCRLAHCGSCLLLSRCSGRCRVSRQGPRVSGKWASAGDR